MSTEAQPEANLRKLFSKTIGLISYLGSAFFAGLVLARRRARHSRGAITRLGAEIAKAEGALNQAPPASLSSVGATPEVFNTLDALCIDETCTNYLLHES